MKKPTQPTTLKSSVSIWGIYRTKNGQQQEIFLRCLQLQIKQSYSLYTFSLNNCILPIAGKNMAQMGTSKSNHQFFSGIRNICLNGHLHRKICQKTVAVMRQK